MSSRMAQALLKLYPQQMRKRYGQELLDLEDELRTQDHVSRARLVRDILMGALIVRLPRQRTSLVSGVVILIAVLAVAGVITAGHGGDTAVRASHAQAQLTAQTVPAAPYRTCPDTGESCSVNPICVEAVSPRTVNPAAARRRVSTIPTARVAKPQCEANPPVTPRKPPRT